MESKKQIVSSLQNLNPQQKKAVIAEDRRVLVLAGAGAGKTKTLLQKILYLIREKGVKPEEILAITFTKNAANEMIDRLLLGVDVDDAYSNILSDKSTNESQKQFLRLSKMQSVPWISKLTIRTFHSLCYSIMKNFGAKEFDNKFKLIVDKQQANTEISALAAEESQFEIIHKILISCCADKDYLLKFKRYVIDYLVDRIHIKPLQTATYVSDGKYFTSLRGDRIRSKSEQYICDWMYRHNIHYIYEPKVDFSGFSFRPDFFIPEANLYLEHISSLSSKSTYKEQQFIEGGRLLVKTFEGMTSDTALFNTALERIIKDKLPASYQTDTILKYEEEMNGKHKEVKDFLRQVSRVLDMIQVDKISIEKLKEMSAHDQHERVRLFYECCIPILEKYKAQCTDKSLLDFNELVNTCINLLQRHEDIRTMLQSRYKYVLVDEFQDVNKIQVELVKSLMDPASQLFCVGDD